MKNILILILIALIVYLAYLYCDKYNLSQLFMNYTTIFASKKSKKCKLNNSIKKKLQLLKQVDNQLLKQANNQLPKQANNQLLKQANNKQKQNNNYEHFIEFENNNHSNVEGKNLNQYEDIDRENSNHYEYVDYNRENRANDCPNGVCKLPQKNTQNKLNPLAISNSNVDIDINLNSEDSLLLTEGALELVDEFVQSKNRPHVFMDIKINEEDMGRIVFELFEDIVPYTVDNFIYMCQNHYMGSTFHRIIKDFVIQGGDYINGDGTGSKSIYGSKFKDENFDLVHDSKYLLSMANSGPDTNGCQFFITLNKLPNLDNKHVVFGRVADDESKLVVDRLGEVFTNNNDMPIVKCEIVDSGLLDTTIITTQTNTHANANL